MHAIPYREYGELSGEITEISTEPQYAEGTGQGFYIVEATVNESKVTNYKGDVAQVLNGMQCEAHVITDRKTIMRFLLEKINIFD